MGNKKLHIVSFDIPSPPDYGGAIDVFYKIKALQEAGVGVILHAYEYNDRTVSEELRNICWEIHTYPRRMDWRKAIGTTPYIMASRNDASLVRRLEKDDHPILLEGMHTAIHLGHAVLLGRIVLLRMHNVEWDYYRHLSKSEKAPLRKLYYFAESIRLKKQRNALNKADKILAISKTEQQVLKKEFSQVVYLPAFHPNEIVKGKEGKGSYALYHGNLAVPENRKAAEWLAEEVFIDSDIPLIIAGNGPPEDWQARWSGRNIEVIAHPDQEQMLELIANAHMHVLPSFQSTGVKLKLLNALYNGRHVIVNQEMIAGNGLEELCYVTGSAEEMRDLIKKTWEVGFSRQEIAKRSEVLLITYNNKVNAARINEWLYPHP
ncbi:MAG: glycosyltransferase [Bacteroidetes bacterium]|nr:glycosyltransferase [Bacteroidota bacterium]